MEYKLRFYEFIITLILTSPWGLIFKYFFIELSTNHHAYETGYNSWIIVFTALLFTLHLLYVRDVSKMLAGWCEE